MQNDIVKNVGGRPAGVVTIIRWWQKMGLTQEEADAIVASGRQKEVWDAWYAEQQAKKAAATAAAAAEETKLCGECD